MTSFSGLSSAQAQSIRFQTPPAHWALSDWSDIPSLRSDDLSLAWNAWLRSCHRPNAMPVALSRLCPDIRLLSLADNTEKLAWLQRQFLPYRVQSSVAASTASTASATSESRAHRDLLTGYYEPIMDAKLRPDDRFRYPLYRPPVGLRDKPIWFSRQEIESSESALLQLRGREIAFLDNPIDVLVIHIQGSARLRLLDAATPDLIRISYADSNRHPYKSIGSTLLGQRLLTDASWPGIKAWLNATSPTQPELVQQVLWSNPRYIFFKTVTPSVPISDGPSGAMGTPLTDARSVAVDPRFTPYGTPLWLQSSGEYAFNHLVFAQDTGSAILGPVRLDLFLGSGTEAGAIAGKLKQSLTLWALWPRAVD